MGSRNVCVAAMDDIAWEATKDGKEVLAKVKKSANKDEERRERGGCAEFAKRLLLDFT